MPYKPGESGNPKGRPKKRRALTELLDKAGAATVDNSKGQRLSGKKHLADLLWQFLNTGRVTFPDGTEVVAEDATEWFNAVKWLYSHIDGPAPAQVDVTSGGDKLEFPAPAVFLPAVDEAQDDS